MKPNPLLPLLACCALCVIATASRADELRWDARTLFDRSVTRDLRLSADGKGIELAEGELFEDDGPAAGFSYRPNEEKIEGRVWIKKELLIPNPAARRATLLVAPGGDLEAVINRRPVPLEAPQATGKYWQAYSIPPDVLQAGKNEIVLRGAGKVWIARAEDFAAGSTDRSAHPNRSARSGDGGKTWDYDRLGPKGDIDGEYYVRLHLEHFLPNGSLMLPAMDAANLPGRAIGPPLREPEPPLVRQLPIFFNLNADSDGVSLLARSGTTAVPDRTWSEWFPMQFDSELRFPKGRYFQVSIDLATRNGLRSPALRSLSIRTNPPLANDWTAKLKLIESQNSEIVRSAIPFAYEPFDHPRLKELRERHKLDDIVQGAKSELETIERLARWSAARWEKGHLSEGYPAWDATEILRPHSDGKPVGGFCQQYNLVLLQACESLGIPGRCVSIGGGDEPPVGNGQPRPKRIGGSGHEVVELWSNQFGKWIYVDGNFAWYAVDAATRVPLSLWELRGRQLRILDDQMVSAGKTEIVRLRDEGKRWEGLDFWPTFHELRLIPRSNFLEAKAPLPLNQGMRGWFWTGHHIWTDAAHPASLIYTHRTSRPTDWNWTLNQVRFTLEATPTLGELRVHLETSTPGLETYLAQLDDAEPQKVTSGFLWKLHAGVNRLAVRPRNVAGRDGTASRIVIEQP